MEPSVAIRALAAEDSTRWGDSLLLSTVIRCREEARLTGSNQLQHEVILLRLIVSSDSNRHIGRDVLMNYANSGRCFCSTVDLSLSRYESLHPGPVISQDRWHGAPHTEECDIVMTERKALGSTS
jgi:hypothetical protein